ncbi:succinate-semialdehyde dehydrogenase [Schizosaccharomyces japonicus yFS275]|uniref:succinate-semialdehyde dehydrogenase [NAD(P)(+)] n=1 Tax=Schizosaccharomyces japonicus (strain yFS275 / FY16936) TaxID=402676 RepID=B6JWA1_SCHJY|nr:succinate-semialdehyde dehydrogenase [Schizosaccharomyces japonicus yFS275]EEB05652.1 succinate-semialdehyde dehydrogenase [Schizosaccharomyces japonicus yFS275]
MVNSSVFTPKISNISLFDLDRTAARSCVNGQWVESPNKKTFQNINPANNTVITEVADIPAEVVEEAIKAAENAFESFSESPVLERSLMLKTWAELVRKNCDDLSKVMTWENGKTLADSKQEIEFSASFLDWYAGEALRIHGDVTHSGVASNHRIFNVKQPIGVCGLITPWNFPAAMIARKAGAAIAAGCTAVIRAAEVTPLTAIGMIKLAQQAGIPKGVLNLILDSNAKVCGEVITNSPIVRKVSFTGSTNVGKQLMSQSSCTVKKMSLELGGNAPFIVFPDADLEKTIKSLMACKFNSNGQVCVCANRIYVHEDIYDTFANALADLVCEMKIGSGFDPEVKLGPLIAASGAEKVEEHVKDAVANGAKILTGGKRPEGFNECYYEPTVLVNVKEKCRLFREETFGPLAALIKFKDVDEVIKSANSSSVGLAGYVYTNDLNTMFRMAKGLEVGIVGANTEQVNDPFLDFGGIKESGYGKEGGMHGVDEFLIEKAISLQIFPH